MKIIFIFVLMLMIMAVSNAAIIQGNPLGSVTIIEVYDYQCPHCHQMAPILEKIYQNNPEVKLRLMPVAISNKVSVLEAAAAISSTHYRGMFSLLNKMMLSGPILSENQVINILGNLKLNTIKFNMLMHSRKVKDQIQEGLVLLKKNHSGTPLFVLYPTAKPKHRIALKGEPTKATLTHAILATLKRS